MGKLLTYTINQIAYTLTTLSYYKRFRTVLKNIYLLYLTFEKIAGKIQKNTVFKPQKISTLTILLYYKPSGYLKRIFLFTKHSKKTVQKQQTHINFAKNFSAENAQTEIFRTRSKTEKNSSRNFVRNLWRSSRNECWQRNDANAFARCERKREKKGQK